MLVFLNRDHTPIITFFVEDFLSSNETILPEDLSIIEKEIRNAISAKAEAEFKSSSKVAAEAAYKSEAETTRVRSIQHYLKHAKSNS